MKTYYKFLLIVLTAVFGAVTSDAAVVITQTKSSSIFGSNTIPFTFDQFDETSDSRFIELLSIEIILNYKVTSVATFQMDSDDNAAQSGTASYDINGSLSSSDVTLPAAGINLNLNSSSATSLDPNDGDAVGVFNIGGGDYAVLSGPSGTESQSGFIDVSNWAAFEGSGTFDISAIMSQAGTFSAFGYVLSQSVPAIGDVSVTVKYTYDAVPEPGTAVSFIFGSALLLFLRRSLRNRS